MSVHLRIWSVVIPFVLSAGSLAAAQPAADPTGHWEGMIEAPQMAIPFEVDFVRNRKGELTGTVDLPRENIKGLPLIKIMVEGMSITFQARTDQVLSGVLAADGQSMSGDFSMSGGTAPFVLNRTGDPRIEAPARSAPIAKALEGTWNGTAVVSGTPMRLVLTLANEDGSAAARMVNLDQGELQVPASAITHAQSTLRLEFKSVGATYEARVNTEGTELAGTFSQGARSVPLTFRRAAP